MYKDNFVKPSLNVFTFFAFFLSYRTVVGLFSLLFSLSLLLGSALVVLLHLDFFVAALRELVDREAYSSRRQRALNKVADLDGTNERHNCRLLAVGTTGDNITIKRLLAESWIQGQNLHNARKKREEGTEGKKAYIFVHISSFYNCFIYTSSLITEFVLLCSGNIF